MRYRVDELANRGGVSVDTVRYYQAQGLLEQPEREGRVAWYGDAHLERLARIRDLKSKGFTLTSIRRLLEADLDPADAALVEAVAGVLPGDDGSDELISLGSLAELTGVSPALLEAIQREGLLAPREVDGEQLYPASDVKVVQAGLELLEAGLPLGELLALAREHDHAMRGVARRAVDMFVRFVRDPILVETSEEDASERLVGAFSKMLPATTSLVANHFRRVLLDEAEARIEQEVSEDSA
jgi:DNA-binding transcriptional MerR regulator